MTEPKIDQLTKDIDDVKRDVNSLKDEVGSFKESMSGTLEKLGVAIHELALAVSESKFKDENLKAYVEQNHKHEQEKRVYLDKQVEELKKDVLIAKEEVNTIKTQQALNNRSISDARGIFLKVVGSVLVTGALAWFSFK